MNLRLKYSIRFGALVAFLIGIFSLFVYLQFQRRLLTSAEQSLARHLEHQWNHASSQTISDDELAMLESGNIHVRVWRNHTLLHDSFPKEGADSEFSASNLEESDKITKEISQEWKGATYRIEGYYDLSSLKRSVTELGILLILGCLLLTLITIPFSWWFTSSLLRPFRELSNATSKINADDLSFRFPNPVPPDEFGQLALNFNSLLSRLEQSISQLKRFAGNVSHEFRTPLAVIQGEAQLMLRKPREQSEYVEAFKNISGQTQLLKQVIQRLLFFADLETVEQEHRKSDVNIDRVVRETVRALEFAKTKANKTIEIESPGEITLEGYPELVSCVVNNLLENALKFSQRKVVVRLEKEPGAVAFRVEDDGPGIPKDRRDEVFEPFIRTPGQANLDGPTGHGLGLSIVKACVDVIRAKVVLDDSPLGGLSVVVRFPQSI